MNNKSKSISQLAGNKKIPAEHAYFKNERVPTWSEHAKVFVPLVH